MLAFGLGLLVLAPFLGRPLVSREQELRVILTARDMARGGDWLVPHYLGEPRLNKPPLQYWLTAAAFKMTGDTQSPTVARLPTALLGAGLLATLAAFGAACVGVRRAGAAVLVAASTVLFWRFGRLAETDMPLACLESLAVFCLFRALQADAAPRWWVAAGLAAGCGFMVKGPAALMLPAAAAVAFHLSTPRAARPPLRWRPALGALALCALLVVPWYAYVLLGRAAPAAAADVTFELGALGARTKHAASPLFYLYTLPLLLMPWGVLLPWAVVRGWRVARRHAGLRRILCWFLSSLAVMSLVPSKQAHYATLLLVPSALLIATWGARFVRRAGPRPGRRRAFQGILALALLACWATGAVFHEFGEPARIVATVVQRLHAADAAGGRVFLAGRRLNSLRYYLDRPVMPVASLEAGLDQAAPGDWVIVAADRKNRVLPSAPPLTPVLACKQGPVTMQVYRKPSPPGAAAAGARPPD